MSTHVLLQRVFGGIGTTLVGVVAEHHGLRLPLFITAAVASLAGVLALTRRGSIAAAFAKH